MQRLLLSLAVVVAVGGAVVASTGAFFSDTEASTGNTFTAGSIDLTVDSTQHYNNAVCVLTNADLHLYTWQLAPNATAQPDQYPVIGSSCDGSWTATNLGPTNKFFDFGDVKPADQGEDTVSMHLATNPAWACADIALTGNADNGVTGPETLAGDTTDGPFAGELAQNLSVFIWNDNASTSGATAGDNVYQTGEKVLAGPETLATLLGGNVNGPATTSIALADSTTGTGPLGAGSSSNIGIEWCAGTFTGTPGVNLTCDGSTMGNNTQTDSVVADITMRVSQSRNQPTFTCSTGTVAGPQTTTVTTNSLFTTNSIPTAVGNGDWFFYNDTNDSIMSLDQFNSTGGKDHMDTTAGVQGALMTLDSGTQTPDYTGHIGQPRYNIATYQFQGTLLTGINALAYRVYDATVDSDVPFLGFDVDFATSTLSGYEGRLTYQPGTGGNAALPASTWTTVDALNSGNGMWTWSHFASNGNKWPDGNTNQYRTWNSIVAAFTGAKILTPGGFFGVRVGEPGPVSASATVDYIKFNNTTYDFQI